MSVREELQLDRRLAELRQTIRTKRNNVADLEAILYEDVNKMKKLPVYFWVLLIAHFLVMLEGWRHQRGFQFLFNLLMVLWLQRKVYREIAMQLAVPVGLGVLLVTVLS